MAGAKPASEEPKGPVAISVSRLAERIEGALKAGLPAKVLVRGELSQLTDRTHWYFTLKDSNAVISCVMFASAARKVGFKPSTGDEVIATGRVEFWGKGGRTQLYVERLEPVGRGALDQQLRERVELLRARGWLDDAIKKPLPTFPRRIAVITSETSAALQDVIDTARRRCPAVDLAIADVRVQGDGAAPQVANAIRWIGAHHEGLGIDAIIVTRGGGSIEDLWAFNELAPAEAIHGCPIPVVAAIGHETDVTLAELVADERCATPTQAVMRLTPDREALGEQLAMLVARRRTALIGALGGARTRLGAIGRRAELVEPRRVHRRAADQLRELAKSARQSLRLRASSEREALGALSLRLERHRPMSKVAQRRARADAALAQLHAALRTRVRSAHREVATSWRAMGRALEHGTARSADRLESASRELVAVSPMRVLARGYSMTHLTTADGASLVRSIADAPPGSQLRTTLADGVVVSRVESEDSGRASPLRPRPAVEPPRPRRKRRSAPKDDPSTPGLFGP